MEGQTTDTQQRLVIRISRNSLIFSYVVNPYEGAISCQSYPLKAGITMAANLREALRQPAAAEWAAWHVLVMMDAPVLIVPADLFQPSQQQLLYAHAYPDAARDVVMHTVLPDLNCVAVYAVNADLKTVLDDHFPHITYSTALAPLWRHLHQRSYNGIRGKLYGYLHDGRLDIASYAQNRFKFCNTYDTPHLHDVLYFLLYVWQQLSLKADYDELHICGPAPDVEQLAADLRRYVKRVYVVNPAADFNRAAVTQLENMPYDLMTLYVKGR